MTTISVETRVNQATERFRNEVLSSYISIGNVSSYSLVVTELTEQRSELVIDVPRLLVLSYDGQLLIQLRTTDGDTLSFSSKQGTLTLPFSGRVTCTRQGTATNPRVIKHVAL